MKPKILFTFSLIESHLKWAAGGMKQKGREAIGLTKNKNKNQVDVWTQWGGVHILRTAEVWHLPAFHFSLILSCSINVLLTVLCFRASNVQTTKTAELLKPLCWRFTIVTEMRTDRSVHNFLNSSRNHSTSDGMFLLLNNLVSLHVNLKIYFPSMFFPCYN